MPHTGVERVSISVKQAKERSSAHRMGNMGNWKFIITVCSEIAPVAGYDDLLRI